MNLGIYEDVSTLLKDKSSWLIAVHCSNHHIELPVKDTFENIFFEEIDKMLVFLSYSYQKNSKRLRDLQELGRALRETITKPIKATGIRWMTYHYNAIKAILKYYGTYMTHLEEIANLFFLFNWDSLNARLNSHCRAWSYKKKKHKKIKAYRKSV